LHEFNLYGKLKIPGLTFQYFVPTKEESLNIAFNDVEFKVFVIPDAISIMLDVSEVSKHINIPVEYLFAQFSLPVNNEDLELIKKEDKWPENNENLADYIELMKKLRKKLWEFSRFELGQNLDSLDYSYTPEIALFKQLPTGEYKHLSHPQSVVRLEIQMPDEFTLFGKEDIEAFQKHINKEKERISFCWQALMNAYDYFDRRNYRMAIVESNIALERGICIRMQKHLPNNVDIDDLLKSQKVTSVIKCVLPLVNLISEEFDISQDLLDRLIIARTKRNKILHNSQKEVKKEVAKKALTAIEELLDIVEPRYLTEKRRKLNL